MSSDFFDSTQNGTDHGLEVPDSSYHPIPAIGA
jgi:hypothetical protein